MALTRRRPGTRIRFVGEVLPRVLPSFADTVAIPTVASWGPLGSETSGMKRYPDMAAVEEVYGTDDSPLRTAVNQAFRGEDVPGAGGAGGVIPYRMAGNAKARSTITIQNTAGTPADALRLDGKYFGTTGNTLAYTVQDDPQNAAQDILRIYRNGAVAETFRYLNSQTTQLALDINARSRLVTATVLSGGGSPLALASSPVSLAGGNDGATLTLANWTDALTALTFERYSLLAPYDLTDSTVVAALLQWTRDQDEANRPVMVTIGGAAGETLATANTRTGTLNEPHVVNVGVGTYRDLLLQKDLSTSQLAPRIAGIMAARGETADLTFALLGNLTAVVGPAPDEIQSGINAGTTMISRATSSADADLHVEMGVTSYTTDTNSALPVEVFGNPRLVRVMDIFLRGMKEWGDSVVIGRLPNNADTRAAVDKEGKRRVDDLLTRGLILPGNADAVPPVPAPEFRSVETVTDSLPFKFGWQFARTTNYIDGEGKVR